MEEGSDLCTNINITQLEQASSQIIDQIVNIDLSNIQFDTEKLAEQAELLGFDISDIEFPQKSYKSMKNYAKCIHQKTSPEEMRHLVKYLWNLPPFSWFCPIPECILEVSCQIICFPCICLYPFDKLFCTYPCNLVCEALWIAIFSVCFFVIVIL